MIQIEKVQFWNASASKKKKKKSPKQSFLSKFTSSAEQISTFVEWDIINLFSEELLVLLAFLSNIIHTKSSGGGQRIFQNNVFITVYSASVV